MSTKTILFSILLNSLTCLQIKAQTTLSKQDNSIIGVWKGTSICQAKNSPCHDENVVYRISKGQGIDTFSISGSKIVNGKEVEMGIIPFRFDKTTNQLTASNNNGEWTLNLKGKVLEGTLTSNGKLFRIVKLSKQN